MELRLSCANPSIYVYVNTRRLSRFHRVLLIIWRHLSNKSLYQPIDNQLYMEIVNFGVSIRPADDLNA